MKEFIKLPVVAAAVLLSMTTRAQIPSSTDLGETDRYQRRDLSIARSRIVVNPFNFHTDPAGVTPSVYSNSPALPLNIGYLTAGNAEQATKGRFGREFKDVLRIGRITAGGRPAEAATFATGWYPHALSFRAAYPDGTEIEGYDFFYDENTVVRTMHLDKGGKYLLWGRIRGGASVSAGHSLVITSSDCKYAVSGGDLSLKDISFYASEEDLKNGTGKRNDAGDAGWWAVVIPGRRQADIAVSFGLLSESDRAVTDRAVKASRKNNAAKAFAARVTYWDDFLKNKIPHPADFSLESVDAMGVTPEELRLTYYKAWVLLEQNIIPPEGDVFPYYQVATGKASLWDEGHETAPFSAAWESFVGLQMYAYIDPEVSWSCLKGLLSLVDRDGMLGGESLPSRKAHSAWVLYQLSKDRESLREVYPALERYLDWRMSQPRWIYKDATPENEKDAEFVVSAIVDMEYMSLIAKELGMDDGFGQWTRKRSDFISRYKGWFWKTPQDLPTQHVDAYPERHENPGMITTGMYIPEMKGDYFDGLLGKFYAYYDTGKPFAGFTSPKYPDLDFTVYGLIENGKDVLARGLLEATLRDIVRTHGMFAESYSSDARHVYPDGVRPSIFGLASIIDFTLLKNGYMYTKGYPCAVNLYPGSETGVDGISFPGKRINIKHTAGTAVRISEPATGQSREIEVKTGEIKAICHE